MKENGSSFRQGMPESSAMDGNSSDAHVRDLGNAVGHRLPSLDDGCIRDILVPHPSRGEAVQIGYPADLSGIHAGMTALFAFLTIYIASCDPWTCLGKWTSWIGRRRVRHSEKSLNSRK
jgi:hypothetical protein